MNGLIIINKPIINIIIPPIKCEYFVYFVEMPVTLNVNIAIENIKISSNIKHKI